MKNEELIALRKYRYFTQEKLAKALGLSRYYVWLMENHGHIPSNKVIERMAIVLDVSEAKIKKILKIKK